MQSDGWEQSRVADLVERGALRIDDGYRVRNVELGPRGIPFVRGGDIGLGWIETGVADHIRPEYADRVRNKLARPWDVAFITKGTVGRVGLLRPGQPDVVFAPQVCFWRVLDRRQLCPRFLFYLLRSPEFQAHLDAVKTHGSMVADYVSLSDQRRFRLTLPPIDEQERIGEILGAIDDKIELNRRMNGTLEAIARAVFKSWFVDFDPVRAKLDGRRPERMDDATAALFPSELVHAPSGLVPLGWRQTTLGDVISIHDSKRVPLSSREREKRRGAYPYYGAASVMDFVDDYLFDGVFVLMGEDGSVVREDGTPVLQYVWGKFWVNNHAHVLTGKNGVCNEHLLLHLSMSNITPFVTGAVQPKLNQANMNRIDFLLPTPPACEAFRRTITPLFARYRQNSDESRTLATVRDALLPKLLSGEVRVREAEKVVEAVA